MNNHSKTINSNYIKIISDHFNIIRDHFKTKMYIEPAQKKWCHNETISFKN